MRGLLVTSLALVLSCATVDGQTAKQAEKTVEAGTTKPAGERKGRRHRHRRPHIEVPSLDKTPTAQDDAEKKILEVLDEMDKHHRRGNMNVPVPDGRLLRMLAETMGAKHVVEIGTSNGFSGLWICLALRKTGGKLTTYEINARRANLARENFKKAGVEKYVNLIEGDAHEEITKLEGPVDMVFIDADKEGYPDYLEKLLPKLRKGGLILAHNTGRQEPGIEKYIQSVTSHPELETIFLNMHLAGIGVTMKKR